MYLAKRIEHFITFVDSENMTKAAEQLHISQSALSQSIRRLEDSLGVKLIHRDKRAGKLTEFGAILYGGGSSLQQKYQEMIGEIHVLKNNKQLTLKLGCGRIWSEAFLPKIIYLFNEMYPDVKVIMQELDSKTILSKLSTKEIDIGFGALPTNEVIKQFDVECVDLVHFEYAVFTANKELLSLKSLGADDLKCFDFVYLNHGDSLLNCDYQIFGVGYNEIKIEANCINSAMSIVSLGKHVIVLPTELELLAKFHGIYRLAVNNESPKFKSGVITTATPNSKLLNNFISHAVGYFNDNGTVLNSV